MAKKRRIQESQSGADGGSRGEVEEPLERGGQTRDQGGREWIRNDIARRWYWLLCLAVDVFGGLQVAMLFSGSTGTIAALVFLVAATVVEFLLYRVLWEREEDGAD